ncbi:50S ribosomal protein L15e [Candidatus Nanosalina sp. VS9-1]|uniref:50S ribosomal protein L15e n=1 Tax=Candidatus Nanosalina sp. VS9-1 TaxID=3388566 RepID=UPI0039E1D1E7
MGYYKYARENYNQPKENLDELWQERLVEWRKQEAVVEVENPTRRPKAREKGYKAKNGFKIVRVKVDKGGTKRKRPDAGRAPSKTGQSRYSRKKSKQVIGEQRVSRKYSNLEVLDSYWVAEDGNRKWFEVIMVDPDHPEIQSDDDLKWIADNRDRAERGVTPAAKSSRGQDNKGTGAEKVRPSQNAKGNRGK